MGNSRVATPTTRITDARSTDRTALVKRLPNIVDIPVLKMTLLLTWRKLP